MGTYHHVDQVLGELPIKAEFIYLEDTFKKSDEYYNDLYEYNLEELEWKRISYSDTPPSERIDHTCSIYQHHMYVFGGFDGNSRFNDFWRLDLRTFKWKKIIGCGETPSNRFGHTACVYDHSLFIFGGWNGHFTMDDIFQYSFASNYWYEIKRTKPLSRYRHSAVMVNQKMYIFGGVDTTKQRFNDFYSYDVEKRLWIKEETMGDIPKARTFHRAVSFGNIMYLLGGFDGNRLNDMHIIALPVSLYEEDRDYLRMSRRPNTSGSILTVPSDMPVEEFDYEADENDLKYTVMLLK